MELAYFSRYARPQRRQTGGAGVVLRFQRVRAGRMDGFQPHKAHEITPQFLERAIRALKRWKYDIVSMDEVCCRAASPPMRTRFAALTFDGGYKDVITTAYPILQSHGVPFTVYLPTAFPDGLGDAWWLALEQIIAREERISLIMDRRERHFLIDAVQAKYELYHLLYQWLRTQPPADLSSAMRDLCRRYSVDMATLSRRAWMNWDDLARLAGDPKVVIASATVSYPALSSLRDGDAQREISMGKAVMQAALHRDVKHFAFPFGDREAWRRRHAAMAEEGGFASAASALPGVIDPLGRTDLHALPRIDWDGRQRSLRVMRIMLSGATFAPVQPTRQDRLTDLGEPSSL